MDNTFKHRKQQQQQQQQPAPTAAIPPKDSQTVIRNEPTKRRVADNDTDFSLLNVTKTLLGLIALNFVLSYFVTGTPLWGSETKLTNFKYLNHIATHPFTHNTRVFSEEELSLYDGAHGKQHIFVAVNGSVYDVSVNPQSYGPLGGYHFFAGRDAARAFVTGCFRSDLTHDLRGLDFDNANAVVAGWQRFFEKSHKYWKVGTVVHESLEGKPMWPPCEKGASQPRLHRNKKKTS